MPSLPTGPGHGYDAAANLKWSSAEKAIARRAFDQALQLELQAVMTETKKRAAKIQRASDLWNLERYLAERRSQIDQQFDYRYSVLIQVFGDLVHRGRLSEQELQGLDEDKLDLIRHYAAFLIADSC